jgi:hypothetical protein
MISPYKPYIPTQNDFFRVVLGEEIPDEFGVGRLGAFFEILVFKNGKR